MGEYFTGLLTNRVLLAAVAGWTTAQVLKTLLVLLIEKELRLERLMGSGGMPSSHSATTYKFKCGFVQTFQQSHYNFGFLLVDL